MYSRLSGGGADRRNVYCVKITRDKLFLLIILQQSVLHYMFIRFVYVTSCSICDGCVGVGMSKAPSGGLVMVDVMCDPSPRQVDR